jgi:hypothetical protein
MCAAGGESVTRSTRLYDDDGMSIAYEGEHGAFYWTDISCTSVYTSKLNVKLVEQICSTCSWSRSSERRSGQDTLACTVGVPKGAGFPYFPAARAYTWRFPGACGLGAGI